MSDLVTTARSIVATEDNGDGLTYVLYSSEPEAESATRVDALNAGAIPRRVLGGRLSPTLVAFVSVTGSTAGALTVERNCDQTTLPPLGIGDFSGVCGSYWNSETTRAAFGMAEVPLEYGEAGIAGINPEGYDLFRYCAVLADETEDGYLPESGPLDGPPNQGDTNGDGKFSLSELLRVIQSYATGGEHACPDGGTEDGFCPGAAGAAAS